MDDRYIATPGFSLSDVLATDLRGVEFRLNRIRPTYDYAARSFSIPVDGQEEEDVVETFEGVIALHHEVHEFHADPSSAYKKAPECFSYDGISGCGTPGGLCSTCPRRLYRHNYDKAICKAKRRLYIFRPGQSLPNELIIPGPSMQNFSLYLRDLIGKYQLPGRVVTRFRLKRHPNSAGIQISKVCFDMVRPLDNEELAHIQSTVPALEEFMQRDLETRRDRSRPSFHCSAD